MLIFISTLGSAFCIYTLSNMARSFNLQEATDIVYDSEMDVQIGDGD